MEKIVSVLAQMSSTATAFVALATALGVTWKWSYPSIVRPFALWVRGIALLPTRVESITSQLDETSKRVVKMDEAVTNGGKTGIVDVLALVSARNRILFGREAAFESTSSGRNARTYPGFTTMLGWTADEMVGDGWERIIHVDDVEDYMRAWSHSVRERVPFRYPAHGETCRFYCADGTWLHVNVTAEPTAKPIGGEIVWCGIVWPDKDTMHYRDGENHK